MVVFFGNLKDGIVIDAFVAIAARAGRVTDVDFVVARRRVRDICICGFRNFLPAPSTQVCLRDVRSRRGRGERRDDA